VTRGAPVGQAPRRLVDGAKRVRIFGDDVAVRARIATIGGLSAHADQAALLDWMKHFRQPPRQTFLVHDKRKIQKTFAAKIKTTLGWPNIVLPEVGEVIPIR